MDGLTQTQKNSPALSVFAGGGEMGELMRRKDWSLSALAPVENWSPSLKTALRIILGSRYPMFIWWGHQFINFYNDAYIPILGQRHPAALGQSACDVWADVWDIVGSQAEAVLNKGEASWNKELLMIMERNGYLEETYLTFSYSPISDDDGSPGGVFCAVTEETERVLADRRLQTLRELSTEMAKANTVEEVCQFAANVFTNNPYDIPFALIYRLDNESEQVRLVSTTHSDTIAIAQASERFNQWLLNQELATDESSVIENVEEQFGALPGAAWSQPPNQAVVLPLHRSGQEAFGFLIVGVSPYRLLDEDYQGFFNVIAGQVATACATARAYEEERDRAEALAELDRAKTEFFSNVSHEFRTPLTLMLGPAEDALSDRENPLSPHQRQRIEVMQRNGLRLLKLVNTLLDFSRIESDRTSAFYESTDLATFTAELASVFRSAIEKASLRLVVDCPPLPEPVYVDREMWEKIVLNLLSNAFKFTFRGEITVHLHQVSNQVELAVQDTGIGIPTAEIPHLFERFHRVKGAKGRTFEGSGIGLALVQELVKLHGGTIEVSSVEGEGSCFRVSVPTGFTHLPPERIGATCTITSTAMEAAPYVEEALQWLPQEAGEQGSTGVGEEQSISLDSDPPQPPYPSNPPLLRGDIRNGGKIQSKSPF